MRNRGDGVWLFHGSGGRFASAVFGTREVGTAWIYERALSGVLTWYPVGESCYDWAVREGMYRPKAAPTPKALQRFTSGAAPHFHFEDGEEQ